MRNLKLSCSILSVILLAGCGGGGSGGGVGSTPTPTSANPVSRNTSLINPTQNDEFAATVFATKASISKTTGGAVSVDNIAATANTIVNYNAASKGYSIDILPISTGSRFSFNEGNKSLADSNSVLTVYKKTSGSRSEQLILFNPGSSNPNFQLTYTSYGAWLTLDERTTTVDTALAYFVFGTRTSAADMPRTGTATYSTILDGTYVDSSGIYIVAGSGNFSADFAAATVAFQANPVGINAISGSSRSFGSFNGTGTIDMNTALFTTNSATSGDYSFNAIGRFYGPGAAEIGAAFGLSSFSGGKGVGAMVGKKD